MILKQGDAHIMLVSCICDQFDFTRTYKAILFYEIVS